MEAGEAANEEMVGAEAAAAACGAAATEQEAAGKLEALESTPFVQVRVPETHWLPAATEAAWKAVTVAPLATLWPLNVQDWAAATLQVAAVKVPERVPLEQVRVCCWHEEPKATEEDWNAFTEAPLATDWLLNVQEAAAAACGAAATEQEAAGKLDALESVPLVQVRVPETHWPPAATEAAWKPVAVPPL